MVLVLGRGGFCPKDRRQAEGLVSAASRAGVGYCRLVTISTDNIMETNEYRSGVGAHWPFLSDQRRIVQKDLDIAEYTDPQQSHDPACDRARTRPVSTRSTTATGFSAGRPWKSSGRICAPFRRNAGRTGISRRPNSRRHGSRAGRNCSIRTERLMHRLWLNRTSSLPPQRGGKARHRPPRPSPRPFRVPRVKRERGGPRQSI